MSAVTTMADWALRCLDPATPKAAKDWGTGMLRQFRDTGRLPTIEHQADFEARCRPAPAPVSAPAPAPAIALGQPLGGPSAQQKS